MAMKEKGTGNTETKSFVPAAPKQRKSDGGRTKMFDSVKKPRSGGEKKSTKTSAAAKNTAKGVWFVVRKVLTYTLNVLFTLLAIGIITGTVVALTFIMYIKDNVDPNYKGLDNLKFGSSLSTELYYTDSEGNEIQLEEDTLESGENRLWAEYKDIPKLLIDAYIAVEDQRFWEHGGVDFTRTASAIYNFFIPTSSSYGGGSTITQQLIKNVSQENQVTVQRKVQEILRAFNVEKKYTKEDILEMYLNTIYLSHHSYGVRVAAQTYFGKELNDLTLAECASIAAIGKWPVHYDPISNPKNNLTRRNLVLKLMLEQGKISEEQFLEAYDAPITLKQDKDDTEEVYGTKIHSYYIDAVMDDVSADLMEKYGYDKTTASKMLYSGGLRVVTCLDPTVQESIEKVYTDSSYWPQSNGMQAQSAMVVMRPSTGEIVGIVGGLGEKRESRGLNRATQSRRQCGSSIKPVSLYAYAIDTGLYNFGTPVDDIPPMLRNGSYWPRNSDRTFRGLMSFDVAIQLSLNTVAVRTCELLGLSNVYNNLVQSGYTTLVASKTLADGSVVSDINYSPLALGGMTYGVTVREHTQAYATLANKGYRIEAHTYKYVLDNKGNVLLDNRDLPLEKQYEESTCAIMTDMLERVVNGPYGTASGRVNFYRKYNSNGATLQTAGKTGTTTDKKDVYYCGYTPDLIGCTWYGYDNNKVITTGGNCAAQLWNSVFDEIYSAWTKNGTPFESQFYYRRNGSTDDAGVVRNVEYCTLSGKLATDACRKDFNATVCGGMSCIAKGTFRVEDIPTETCDVHIMCSWDTVTKALCLDGCTCPEANLEEYGFRKMNIGARNLEGKVYVKDAQSVYIEVPAGYIYPSDTKYPFFQKLLSNEYAFGYASDKPYNRVCTEHLDPLRRDNSGTPTDPDDPGQDIPAQGGEDTD